MRFSLFFELQLADPTGRGEAQMIHDCLEQACLADELGYHCVWAVEHHGLFEYSHSSAPEVFLSFVAARTRRIRIGHGVALLPHRYNHPLRVAERAAMLDVLSGGRLELGTGKSASAVEQGAFGCDPATLQSEWLEALEMIPRAWREEPFEHRSERFQIPPTRVIPKPLQAPHPPLWAACSQPQSAELAGRLGLGALNFAIGDDAELAAKVAGYRAAVRAASPSGRSVNNRFACTPATLVLPDHREACAHGVRGSRFFIGALAQYYFSGERSTDPVSAPREPLNEEELRESMEERRHSPAGSQLTSIIGDPAAACEVVDRFRDAGVDDLNLVMQLGTVPHEVVLRSIRTFAEQVMPRFG